MSVRKLPWILAPVLAVFFGWAACSKKDAPADPASGKPLSIDAAAEGSRRNFVLVTIDTLRADAVGAYGGEWKTPHLDAFAKRAVVFEQAFATAPFTGPSHASILTSRHPSKHGVLFNGHRVRGETSPDSIFVSEHLKALGFATAAAVSGGPTRKRYGFGRGFERFHDTCPAAHGDITADGACVVAHARRWLQRRPTNKPFFLWVHLFDPHFPYVASPKMYERQGLDAKEWVATDKEVLRTWPPERVRRAYLADVYEADHHFGTLMEALSALGLLSSTVVAVTSDHGEHLGEHGIYGHSGLYDEALHVPLMVAAPGLRPGRASDLVSTIDLVPTALDILGAPSMPSAQGRSALDSSFGAGTHPVFAEWRHFRVVTDKANVKQGDFQLGVRTDTRKLIVDWLYPDDASMLFDLKADPAEEHNRILVDESNADALAETLKRHTEQDLDAHHLERSDIEIDAQTLQMLQALGYVE